MFKNEECFIFYDRSSDGYCKCFLYGFLFLLLEEFHASKTMMGLSLLVSCVSELIMFPFSFKIIDFIGGPLPCMALGVFSYFLRFLLLSFIDSAWFVLPIQLLHAVGYGIFWSAVLTQLETISPSRICTSMHALIVTLHFDIGSLIANVVGGVLYDLYKGQVLYQYVSFVCLFWTFVVLIDIFLKIRKTHLKERRVKLHRVVHRIHKESEL